MAHFDYIVVGLGISGVAFCRTLERERKTFLAFDSDFSSATSVASGLYNPVSLKFLKPTWNAVQHVETAAAFYRDLEVDFGKKIHQECSIYRKINCPNEQNEWFRYSQKSALSPFLNSDLKTNTNPSVIAPYGFGEVMKTGYVKAAMLREHYIQRLKNESKMQQQPFHYEHLKHTQNIVSYKRIEARRIVFCEGFGMKNNMYFNQLPLVGNKGEVLTIDAPQLRVSNIIHSSVFVVPFDSTIYKVGATYNAVEKTPETTIFAKEELRLNLGKLVRCSYTIVDHQAGIRPTVSDKKPILGKHPKYPRMAILNGMGSRGILMAPFLAETLYRHLENSEPIPEEVSISRFLK